MVNRSPGNNSHGEQSKIQIGLSFRGELAPASKLTSDQVLKIHEDTRVARVIAMEYGVSLWHINKIKRGTVWSWLTQHKEKANEL